MTDRPALDGQSSPLAIGEPQAPPADLLAEDAVLLAQEGDDLKLAGVDPARHPEDQEPHSLGTHRGGMIARLVIHLGVRRTMASRGSKLFGNGDGTFQARIDLEGIPHATAVAVADIDGDGRQDVLAASNLHREVYVLSRGFTPIHVGASPLSIVVADVSGDGKPDLVVPNRDGANVSVELGNGNGTFRDVPPATGPSSFFFLADLDHDGQLDAVGPGTGANVQVQRGVGDGTFQAPVPYPVDVPIAFAVPADVNHDGKPDIVMLNNKTSPPAGANLSVLIGNGDATFQPRIDQATDPGVLPFAAADLDGDGNADVIEGYSSGGNDFLRVQLGNGDGAPRALIVRPTAPAASRRWAQRPCLRVLRSQAVPDATGEGRLPEPCSQRRRSTGDSHAKRAAVGALIIGRSSQKESEQP